MGLTDDYILKVKQISWDVIFPWSVWKIYSGADNLARNTLMFLGNTEEECNVYIKDMTKDKTQQDEEWMFQKKRNPCFNKDLRNTHKTLFKKLYEEIQEKAKYKRKKIFVSVNTNGKTKKEIQEIKDNTMAYLLEMYEYESDDVDLVGTFDYKNIPKKATNKWWIGKILTDYEDIDAFYFPDESDFNNHAVEKKIAETYNIEIL